MCDSLLVSHITMGFEIRIYKKLLWNKNDQCLYSVAYPGQVIWRKNKCVKMHLCFCCTQEPMESKNSQEPMEPKIYRNLLTALKRRTHICATWKASCSERTHISVFSWEWALTFDSRGGSQSTAFRSKDFTWQAVDHSERETARSCNMLVNTVFVKNLQNKSKKKEFFFCI